MEIPLQADPKLHCFCDDPEDPESCPPRGTFSLFKCVGAPMSVSLPHFYAADSKLSGDIGGLHPNEQDHAIFLDFELTTGTPFNAAKRLQFNLEVEPVEQLDEMKKMRKLVQPMFWVQESVALNKTWTDMLKPLFIGKKVNKIIRNLCLFFGIAGILLSGIIFAKKGETIPVTTNVPIQNVRPSIDSKKF
ncbi:Snmp1.2 family protein [Megaselia abdita]